MNKLFTKEWFTVELKSFSTTFLAVFAMESAVLLNMLWNGEILGWALWSALAMAMARSALKAILMMLFPHQFPPRLEHSPVLKDNTAPPQA